MITSVTSAVTSAAIQYGPVLAVGGALLVVGLLMTLELTGATSAGQLAMRRGLRIAVAPLLVVFVTAIAARVLEVLAR